MTSMMNNILLFLFAVSALIISAGAESYALAKKDFIPPAGTVHESSEAMNLADGKMQMNVLGQMMNGTMGISESATEKVEFLSAEKIRYTLIKGESEKKVMMQGQALPGGKSVNSIAGKAVIITRKGDKWTGALEEGTATTQELLEIDGVVKKITGNSDFDVYGETLRKVGDEWEVDGAEVMGFDGMEGKVKVKFVRVEKYQGVDCAVLESTFDVKGTAPGEEMKGVTMGVSGTVTLHRSLKDLVDLNGDFKGQMKMDGKMPLQPGMDIGMKMNGNVTMKSGVKVTRP